MNREPVRDFYKRIIGWIDTDATTGNQIGRDFYQRIVGYYDAKLNLTRDSYQRVVNYGNMLTALINQAELEDQQKKKKNR